MPLNGTAATAHRFKSAGWQVAYSVAAPFYGMGRGFKSGWQYGHGTFIEGAENPLQGLLGCKLAAGISMVGAVAGTGFGIAAAARGLTYDIKEQFTRNHPYSAPRSYIFIRQWMPA